jgi:hypothetical protein
VIIKKELPNDGPLDLHFAACIHWPLTNREILESLVSKVSADPSALVFLIGDQFDGWRTTLRTQIKQLDSSVWVFADDLIYRLVDELAARLKPISRQIVSISEGNHYAVDQNGISSDQLLARTLEVPFVGSDGVVVLGFPTQERLVIKLHHTGGGNASTHSGDAAALAKQADKLRSDIYAIAHTHDTWGKVIPEETVNSEGTARVRNDRAFIRAGVMRSREEEYADTQTVHKPDYAHVKAYAPKAEGWMSVRVEWRGESKVMTVIGPNR